MAVALAAAVVAAVAAMWYAVRGRSGRWLAPSVWRGPSGRRAVVLTFDDGPSESTPRLLELLASLHVRATFFLCGQNARRLPEVARRICEAGHEIGNHGFSHSYYHLRSPSFVREDVRKGQQAILETAGVRPRWFRPPYGVRWFGLRRAFRELGLVGVQWTVIGNDWKLPAAKIVDRVARRVSNGAIVCLHDGRGLEPNPDIQATLDAVSQLIPLLRSRGFELETLGGLLGGVAEPAGAECPAA